MSFWSNILNLCDDEDNQNTGIDDNNSSSNSNSNNMDGHSDFLPDLESELELGTETGIYSDIAKEIAEEGLHQAEEESYEEEFIVDNVNVPDKFTEAVEVIDEVMLFIIISYVNRNCFQISLITLQDKSQQDYLEEEEEESGNMLMSAFFPFCTPKIKLPKKQCGCVEEEEEDLCKNNNEDDEEECQCEDCQAEQDRIDKTHEMFRNCCTPELMPSEPFKNPACRFGDFKCPDGCDLGLKPSWELGNCDCAYCKEEEERKLKPPCCENCGFGCEQPQEECEEEVITCEPTLEPEPEAVTDCPVEEEVYPEEEYFCEPEEPQTVQCECLAPAPEPLPIEEECLPPPVIEECPPPLPIIEECVEPESEPEPDECGEFQEEEFEYILDGITEESEEGCEDEGYYEEPQSEFECPPPPAQDCAPSTTIQVCTTQGGTQPSQCCSQPIQINVPAPNQNCCGTQSSIQVTIPSCQSQPSPCCGPPAGVPDIGKIIQNTPAPQVPSQEGQPKLRRVVCYICDYASPDPKPTTKVEASKQEEVPQPSHVESPPPKVCGNDDDPNSCIPAPLSMEPACVITPSITEKLTLLSERTSLSTITGKCPCLKCNEPGEGTCGNNNKNNNSVSTRDLSKCPDCGENRGENSSCRMCNLVKNMNAEFAYAKACAPAKTDEEEECDCEDCQRKCKSFDVNPDGTVKYEGGTCMGRAQQFLWKATVSLTIYKN